MIKLSTLWVSVQYPGKPEVFLMHDMPTQNTRYLFRNAVALFFSYLAVALPQPILSLHVTRDFGLANWLGGLAVGIAFLSTILTRKYAGTMSDRAGAKLALTRGLGVYAAACIICLFSALPALHGYGAFAVLIAGRLLLGLGESLSIVGVIAWNIGLLGPRHSGKVMGLVGMAMYGAFAVGGPAGTVIYSRLGFGALMTVCTAMPLLGLALTWKIPSVQPLGIPPTEPFSRVIGRIWRQGLALCLQGVGFAAIGAFITLYFRSRGWDFAGLALTFFGGGFVLVRIFFSTLPDKVGGVPVARISLLVQALGQFLLWTAPNGWFALAGCLLSGLGCSMVYPSMGVEVVKRVPAELRGAALGGFAAFQDVAYAFTGPLAGLLADHFGYSSIFLMGGLCALAAFGLVMSMRRDNVESRPSPAGP